MNKINQEKAELFSPIPIGGLKVKNRIILPALLLNFSIEGVKLGDEWKQFYQRMAEGGVGLMIVGACHVHPAGQQDALQIGVDHDDWLPELESIAQVIKKGGSTPAIQLNHAGRYAKKEITGIDPVAPSAIFSRYTKLTPRELPTGEVEETIECFADAAFRARKAGFEAIELLGSTGYLISQFLSPVTNQRQDRYGGDFEGRLTFVKELIAGIKSKAGDDYPIIFRHSSKDNVPGGNDENDQRRVAKKLAEWGVHLINMTAGWHDAPVSQIGPSVPHGNFVPYATKTKEEVDIPVSCAVRITEPDLARQLIAEGRLDMVTLGRALIADHDWPRKAEADVDESIRRCICCCHCFDRGFARTSTECSINPIIGKEDVPIPSDKKRVLVIGGGPAGMEAARVLAMRGHQVLLQEKSGKLGGELLIASAPPHKEELFKLAQYHSHELERLGVTVELNSPFEDLKDGFDAIILAAGAREKTLTIEGMTNMPCHKSSDILSGKAEPQDPVCIIGAGLVGGETADFLREKGFKVSMVEILERPFSDMGPSLRWVLAARLKQGGVTIHTSSEVQEITKEGVIVKTPEGEITLKAGCLITAVGYEPDSDIIAKVKQAGIPYCVIGDNKEPRRIKDAVHEGYWAATTWIDGLE
ncbi:NAD(P)/FAD-dependent oxidoreductase [Thermodesulfobacteriota bacterium]